MAERQNNVMTMTRRESFKLAGAAGALAFLAPNLLSKPALASGKVAPQGRIVVGMSQEATVLNPLMPKIEVDDAIHFSLFDALFRCTPEGEVIASLAAEVPTQENGGISADGLDWRVKLRDDVKWHDGAAFTAEDVKFTLELIVNKDFRAWRTAGHSLVKDITVVSPTEITWKMERPFAPYLNFLTETFIVPKHILEKETDLNAAAFNQSPVGTGPFKFVKRVAGDRIDLVANEQYWGEGPYIENLIYKYIPDLTVLFTQFKSGDIDMVGNQYITPDNYDEASKLAGRVAKKVSSSSVECIYLNLERPQFKEKAVREAIYAAVDKSEIINALYYGLPTPVESFMPPTSAYLNTDLPKHEFNIAAANKLLDDAGWVKGSDGIRAKDGVRLAFKNSTTSGNHLREQAQQFIQQTLAQAGIEMTIENLPAAVIWGEFWSKSQFDTVIVGITFLIGADPDVTNRFHSSSIIAKGGRGANNSQFSNARVDELLEEGSRSFDPTKRKVIYDEVQAIIRTELPILTLFSHTSAWGWKDGIDGVTPNGNTRTESWNNALWKRTK